MRLTHSLLTSLLLIASPATRVAAQANLAESCDKAAAMPANQAAATPDGGLFQGSLTRTRAMLEAVVEACGAAEKADPREGRFPHRIGLALTELKRPAEAAAAFERAMADGYAGGYDEISAARMSGALAPALPKDEALGVTIAEAGIAKTGNPETKRGLAAFLMNRASWNDEARARRLLEQSVAQHHVPAMSYLASLIMHDEKATPADLVRAEKLVQDAIAAGSRTAAAGRAAGLQKRGDPGDMGKARRLFAQASESGEPISMRLLGIMLRDGEGGPADAEGARRWFARASGFGDLQAKYLLARSFLHDEPKQQGAGLALLTAASEEGNVDATYHLADILKDGIDVTRDSKRSLELFRKAAEAGSAKALERIGSMYDYGEGVPVDHAEARRWYDRAVEKGEFNAYTDIGMQYDHAMGVERDLAAALGWYRKGAEKGVASAMSNVGYAYEAGRGIKRDYAEAVKWYERAVALDNPAAQHNLANMYLDGIGVKQDRVRGLKLMQRAAENNQPTALNDLALLEKDRPGGSGRRAVDLLRRSVVLKCPEAYLNLGQALNEGWDGHVDYVEGNYWLEEAIRHPTDLNPGAVAAAKYELGKNLVLGRGAAADKTRGIALLREAKVGGNRNAAEFLATYRKTKGMPGWLPR